MILYPPWLQPGDHLAVIAPSGRLKELSIFTQGLELWRAQGYQLDVDPQCYASHNYLAGSDAQRREALRQAWSDPQYRGIICARGGYGCTRLLENWSWLDLDLSSPKWLIGFSDITALLWSLVGVGIASIHAGVVTTLAREPQWCQQRLFDLLRGNPQPPLQGKGWGGGKTTGTLLVGNLTVATHLLQTSCQPSLEGVILALEEVNEPPYRIDRLLTHWRMLGLLQRVRGIALGSFSGCTSEHNSWELHQVLEDRLGDLAIPIVSDLPFGHGEANAALIVGSRVELDGDRGLLLCL